MPSSTNDRTREWAKIGASSRLQELELERAVILKAFPELRHGRLAGTSQVGRRKLSAAARRKLSAGMRKYWARRRAQAAAKH
jgi:hypothetical protein